MASPRKTRKTSFERTGEDERYDANDDELVVNLEDARKLIGQLKEKCRSQAQQVVQWKRRFRMQAEELARTEAQRVNQLKTLSAQLLLFESRLLRKQKDISMLLSQRDMVIARQQRTLHNLHLRLVEAGVECPLTDTDSPLDSLNDPLNDSDSAVVLEEEPCLRLGSYGVARSVSDLTEAKYANRRSNGFLRRPEVLETVYSVEEDNEADGGVDQGTPPTASSTPRAGSLSECTTPLSSKRSSWSSQGRIPAFGSCERLHQPDPPPPPPLTAYNRVMSNHRSVTKVKDVKYKRINKAKSKSLEELRGRLKNWVDKGHKTVSAFDHSSET